MKPNARLRYVVDRLLRVRRTLDDVAAEREELYPETVVDAPPSVLVDGQLELIRGLQEETDGDECMRRIRGGPLRHRATVRWLLKNAVLADGDLYCGGLRMGLRPGTTPRTVLTKITEEIDRAALVQTWAGSRYFGHWLLDDRPTQRMAVAWGPPITTPLHLSQQQREYLGVFGQERPRQAGATLVRELHVFDDIGQNAHRRDRLEDLRTSFQRHKKLSGHVVFICRGNAGARRLLLNEQYLAEKLEQRGVVVVRHPERLAVEALASRIAGARLVVGLDSSGLAHGILGLERGGGLVVISPADRHNNTFKDWCDPLGIRYGVVIAPNNEEGYVVSEDALLRTMDLVLAERIAA